MIETLDVASQGDVVETIGSAFHDHPLIPRDPSGGRSRLLASAVLRAFADAPDARVFGIHRNGKLACAAFVFDDAYEPRGWTLILFLVRMLRVVGCRMMRSFARVLADKPEVDERRLELMILGTREESQGRGLGRALLHHVREFARERGYQAVVLEVAKETPAFGFYLREGFQVEKEIDMPKMPLCRLRWPVAGQGADAIRATNPTTENQGG